MSETNTSPESALLKAALEYAAAGVHVFPTRIEIRGNGKKDVHPIGTWREASTTDPETIMSWWGPIGTRTADAVCIDCGKSGIVGVDQDVTDGKDGIRLWAELDEGSPARVRTGTGGRHDYYRADPDRPVSIDNSGAVADGVDIRGQGGFLFAPPSVDPRGGGWEWENGAPDWSALPPVPEIVITKMTAKDAGKRPKASKAAPSLQRQAPEGWTPPPTGQSSLFATAGENRDFGPGGGYKSREEASDVVRRAHEHFVSLVEENNDRSKYLSTHLGVLIGHGVDVFWTYESALEAVMRACEENGFIAEHGQAYAEQQACRGIDYGMLEPWIEVKPAATVETYERAMATVEPDAVSALIDEMLTDDELENSPPPRQMIHGYLQFDSESWIIGEPGTKKSFVAYDMAARVARGEPWQGMRTSPADVVFIVGEGRTGHGKRVAAWRKRYGRPAAGARRTTYTLPRPVQAADPQAWATLAQACGRIAGWAREHDRGLLVILDTQARVTVGMDENDNAEMGAFVRAVGMIREATGGACVLTIHHTRKDGTSIRGASAINGAATTVLKMEKDGKAGKLAARLATAKQKDMEEREDLKLGFEVIDLGTDDEGDPVSSLVLAGQDSVAFDQAWSESAADGRQEERVERAEHPITARVVVDHWVREISKSPAVQWALQILVDSGRERGLTKAEVRTMVEEKVGRKLARTTWNDAWTLLTDSCGPCAGLVVGVGGERFTADLVAAKAAGKTD